MFFLITCMASSSLGGEAALRFSGGQVLSAPALPLGPHALEAWVRPDGPLPPGTAAQVIFDWDGRAVLSNSAAGLYYSLDLGEAEAVRIGAPPIPPGEWHHLAAVFDGARARLLIDGKTAAVKIVRGILAGGPEAPAVFGGPRSPLAGAPFAGGLDELRLWGMSRSEEEIEELMFDHLPSALPAGLIAYWDLDAAGGDSAADGASGRDAVLGDFPGPDARDPVWTSQTAPVRKQDPGWVLGFQAAESTSLGTGKPLEVTSTLTSAGQAPGVAAWAIAVRHDRTRLLLEKVSLGGTAAEDRRADGFAKLEIVDDGSRAGFVSLVILSADNSATLPPAGTATLARARYRGVLNFEPSAQALIRYDDRLPSGGGMTPANVVSAGGAERLPEEGRLALDLHSPSFSLALVPALATVPAGSELEVACVLTTSGNTAPTGVSAWSIGVSHDPAVLDLVDFTTAGTVLDQFSGSGIFKLLQRSQSGGTGFVAVVILNFSVASALPPNGSVVIARARYRVDAGVEPESHLDVHFTDGLAGSGVPIENQVDFAGGSQRPEKSGLDIRVARPIFVRGDANQDRRYNIADVISVLDTLYRGGALPRCVDASDVNDDGKLNITDPIYLLQHLFQGGIDPPPPWPEPGEDPTPDGLDCLDYP